jgi:hypothetical protein
MVSHRNRTLQFQRETVNRAHVVREPGNAVPPQAAVIEARNAKEKSWDHPLRYMMGEPLPGRSALDKLRGKVP